MKHERAERFYVIICISIELEKLYELRLWVSNGTLICGFDRALNQWGSKISVRLTIIENVEVLVDHRYHLVLPIRCTLLDLHISNEIENRFDAMITRPYSFRRCLSRNPRFRGGTTTAFVSSSSSSSFAKTYVPRQRRRSNEGNLKRLSSKNRTANVCHVKGQL